MEPSQQDKNVIEGCIKRRPGAWDKFVRQFSGLVMWAIRQRLARAGFDFTNSDAQDIHQEAFLCIYKNNKLSQIRDASKIASWLAVLSGNIAVNYIRRARGRLAEKTVELSCEMAENAGHGLADALEADCPAVDEQIDGELQKEILNRAIESLKPREKIILNLYYICENTVKEISENLNLSQGTVASIIARTKDKIREIFKRKGLIDA